MHYYAMAKLDFQAILDIAQANSYPAMREDFASRSGFSADALLRLEIGYLPFVPFKKGTSRDGYWVTPERDATGVVIGLALRNNQDDKCMYPGSKRGLIYEDTGHRLSPQSNGGFVRTMNAGLVCPVCNKPDGCLLVADNPRDPKAVICLRVGSSKRLGDAGWLHILKPEGNLRGGSVFVGNDPVFIVEGMTDVAALLSLGLTAIGRPSDRAGNQLLADVVRGHVCVVLGENDKKADGREPGREGMVECWKIISTTARSAAMCMPPTHVKDVRAWIVRDKLTATEFLAYIKANDEKNLPSDVLTDARASTMADAYIEQVATADRKIVVRRWSDSWYKYWDGCWAETKDSLFRGPLIDWLGKIKVMRETNKGPQSTTVDPTTGCIGNVVANIEGRVEVSGKMPRWLDATGRPDARDLVLFKNGILNARLFVANAPEERYWIESTPDFFSVTQIPFDFDANATCNIWLDFLESILRDDRECIDLLQEWFGYCLVPDRSFERMLYLHGPTRAGKGCILTALAGMVGRNQVVTTDFATLCSHFGLEDWFGKLVTVIEDARTPRTSDAMRGLERMLNITGGDSVSVARKFKTAISTGDLSARLTVASNEFLDMPDHALVLPRRVNLISLTKSFRNKEDYSIKTKLSEETELQGIINWALAGLVRLRRNGRFTEPSSSQRAMTQWQLETNPMAMFLNETCILEEFDNVVYKKSLFLAWEEWCKERGFVGQKMSETRFYGRIRSNVPGMTEETDIDGVPTIRGIGFQKWATRKYFGEN